MTLALTVVVRPAHAQVRFNPNQVAILRWYKANLAAKFGSASEYGICFDGANIWLTEPGLAFVEKLRASEGAQLGHFFLGNSIGPQGLAFDGIHVWVPGFDSSSVIALNASDGSIFTQTSVAFFPSNIAFDGMNIWVTSAESSVITKVLASTGAVLGTFAVGTFPQGIAFDGSSIWTANEGTVSKL